MARAIARPSVVRFVRTYFFFLNSLFAAGLLRPFRCLISFILFPCASLWEKLVHEFHICIAILNGTSRNEMVLVYSEDSPVKIDP